MTHSVDSQPKLCGGGMRADRAQEESPIIEEGRSGWKRFKMILRKISKLRVC